MSLLEQDITRKGQIDKKLAHLNLDPELDTRHNKEYKVENISDSVIYVKEA